MPISLAKFIQSGSSTTITVRRTQAVRKGWSTPAIGAQIFCDNVQPYITACLILMNIFGTHSALIHVRIYTPPLFNLTIKEIIMMKSKLLNSLILAALAVPGVAMAEDSPFSGNVSLTTDYLYRGITQTGHKGAIQGGFDYAHPSGIYAGAWGSNISWLEEAGVSNSSLELDTYAGFKNSFAEDFSYDVGFLRYNYGGGYPSGTPSANTNEVYGALGWKWFTLKYSYAVSNLFGFTDSSGSGYADLSASYTLEGPDVTLGAHYGHQSIDGSANDGWGYSDYKVSASKDFGGFGFSLAYSSTNVDEAYWGDSAGKSQAVFTVSRSM
jgi:uncharacterized protein (TIGR02001 family)